MKVQNEIQLEIASIRIIMRKLITPMKKLESKSEYNKRIRNGEIELANRFSNPDEARAAWRNGEISKSQFASYIRWIGKKDSVTAFEVSAEELALIRLQRLFNQLAEEIKYLENKQEQKEKSNSANYKLRNQND